MLTKEKIARLQRIDKTGLIAEEDKQELPGIHFCYEWDELPVCKDSPEWECCTFGIKRRMEDAL